MLYNRSFCDNYVSPERALALLSPELFQPKLHQMSSGGQAASGPTREPNHSPSPYSCGQRGMEREEREKGRGEERGEEGKKGMERDAHTRKYATVCAYALTLCCALLKTMLFCRAWNSTIASPWVWQSRLRTQIYLFTYLLKTPRGEGVKDLPRQTATKTKANYCPHALVSPLSLDRTRPARPAGQCGGHSDAAGGPPGARQVRAKQLRRNWQEN